MRSGAGPGQGNVMRKRFFDVADRMHSKPGLPAACVADADADQGNLEDWRLCIFSEVVVGENVGAQEAS